jgi:hypothetical protein
MKDVSEAELREELDKISGKIDSILEKIQRHSGDEDSTPDRPEVEKPKREE